MLPEVEGSDECPGVTRKQSRTTARRNACGCQRRVKVTPVLFHDLVGPRHLHAFRVAESYKLGRP